MPPFTSTLAPWKPSSTLTSLALYRLPPDLPFWPPSLIKGPLQTCPRIYAPTSRKAAPCGSSQSQPWDPARPRTALGRDPCQPDAAVAMVRPLASPVGWGSWRSGVGVENFMHDLAQGLPGGTWGHFGTLAHNWLASLPSPSRSQPRLRAKK